MNNRKLLIKDIAAMSGVSIATVSRVINGTGRCSRATKERVMAIISATRFKPNLVARGLRVKQMNIIGIIVPDITNEFFAKLVNEIQKELFKSSYQLFICNTNEDTVMERHYFEALRSQNVAGIICAGVGVGYAESVAGDIPIGFIDRSPSLAHTAYGNFFFVESNNFLGGRLATERLIERGCREIIMFTDSRRPSSQQDRINGYIEAHGVAGIPLKTSNIINLDEISYIAAYKKTNDLIDQGLRFDGIFASTDLLAIGAYTVLMERGIRVPDDVKLVGFDDISWAQYSVKPITTIRQDVSAISKTVVTELLNRIQGTEAMNKRVIIPVTLVIRETA
jgi:LacI family transcriptional regulator